MTRLPLTLRPLDDESWPSYLTRQAAQHQTTLGGLGSHLGLRDARGRWPGRFGVARTPDDVQRVSPLLGLPSAQIERMQLNSYDQLAFDLTGLTADQGIAGTRAAAHAAWVWLAGSTYCPLCLSEDHGAWRLSWRISWNTTCLRHGVLLRGACPTCAAVPGLGNRLHGSAPPRLAAMPDGRLCTHPELGGDSCRGDLTAAKTPAASPARLHRALVMSRLTHGARGFVAGTEGTSLQTLRGWQATITIAVRLGIIDTRGWGRTHRWANPPRSPDLMDRLLEVAEPLVSAPTRMPPQMSSPRGYATQASGPQTQAPSPGSRSPALRCAPSSTSSSHATAGCTPRSNVNSPGPTAPRSTHAAAAWTTSHNSSGPARSPSNCETPPAQTSGSSERCCR